MKKKLFYIIGTILVIILLGLVLLQVDVVSKTLVLHFLNTDKLEVDFDEWSFDVFSSQLFLTELSFRTMPVNGKDYKYDVVGSAKKVVLQFDLWDLFDDEINISNGFFEDLDVKYKKLFVKVDHDKTTEDKTEKKAFKFNLSDITVKNGTFKLVSEDEQKNEKETVFNLDIKNGNYCFSSLPTLLIENEKMKFKCNLPNLGEITVQNSLQEALFAQVKLKLKQGKLPPIKHGNVELYIKVLKIKDELEFEVDIAPLDVVLVDRADYKPSTVIKLMNVPIYNVMEKVSSMKHVKTRFKIKMDAIKKQKPNMILMSLLTMLITELDRKFRRNYEVNK